MAADRFIYLNNEVPQDALVYQIVQDFFGEAATYDTRSYKDRIFVFLPSPGSSPFRNVPGYQHQQEGVVKERFIEVLFYPKEDRPYIDVITRRQDHFVNALADGLSETLETFFDGEWEQ